MHAPDDESQPAPPQGEPPPPDIETSDDGSLDLPLDVEVSPDDDELHVVYAKLGLQRLAAATNFVGRFVPRLGYSFPAGFAAVEDLDPGQRTFLFDLDEDLVSARSNALMAAFRWIVAYFEAETAWLVGQSGADSGDDGEGT